MSEVSQDLIEKIRELPPEGVAEVLDFVEFLRIRQTERRLARDIAHLSEKAFSEIWDNPEDAEYDKL